MLQRLASFVRHDNPGGFPQDDLGWSLVTTRQVLLFSQGTLTHGKMYDEFRQTKRGSALIKNGSKADRVNVGWMIY